MDEENIKVVGSIGNENRLDVLEERLGLLEKRFNALVEAIDKSKRFRDIKEN